jgi:hypothetical protein
MSGEAKIGFLKRMFTPATAGQNQCEISVGDRYQALGTRPSVWVVERISSVGSSSYPLVSMCREGHPDLKKTVSLAVLQDGADFRPAH